MVLALAVGIDVLLTAGGSGGSTGGVCGSSGGESL
jgi:hypothetical protein